MRKLIIIAILIVLIISMITFIIPEKEIKLPTATGEIIQEKSDELVENIMKDANEKITNKIEETISQPGIFTFEEFSKHNTPLDCWITYENKIYNYTNANIHPNMKTAFYAHCGQLTFEAAAKARHSESNEDRVDNYGEYIGIISL